MNITSKIFALIISLLVLQSCEKKECCLQADSIVGEWELVSTSGGISGAGYEANFDELVITDDLNFELRRDGDLRASGYMESIPSNDFDELYNFTATIVNDQNLYWVVDPEKYLVLENGNLHVNSPCCDRFDFYFERIN